MDDLPQQIMITIVSLIVLSVGVFAFFTVQQQIGVEQSQSQTFTVTDPTVNQTLTLKYTQSSVGSVYQYTGTGWVEVPSSYYTATGTQVVVYYTGLFY